MSNRLDKAKIYVMNSDGSNRLQLTDFESSEPSWGIVKNDSVLHEASVQLVSSQLTWWVIPVICVVPAIAIIVILRKRRSRFTT